MTSANPLIRRATLVLGIGMILIIGASCSQTYYCKLFKIETAATGVADSFSRELLDGPFGSVADCDLTIRVVAVWDSNNKARLANTRYSISIQQRARGKKLLDTLSIDSLVISFPPSESEFVLARKSAAVLSGYYVAKPIVKTTFHELIIPDDVDSIRVDFAVRKPSHSTPESLKDFSLMMTRYEGAVRKFGYRDVD